MQQYNGHNGTDGHRHRHKRKRDDKSKERMKDRKKANFAQ